MQSAVGTHRRWQPVLQGMLKNGFSDRNSSGTQKQSGDSPSGTQGTQEATQEKEELGRGTQDATQEREELVRGSQHSSPRKQLETMSHVILGPCVTAMASSKVSMPRTQRTLDAGPGPPPLHTQVRLSCPTVRGTCTRAATWTPTGPVLASAHPPPSCPFGRCLSWTPAPIPIFLPKKTQPSRGSSSPETIPGLTFKSQEGQAS